MIANVSAHRRANAFAQALEEQSDQGTAAEQPDGSAPSQAASGTAPSRAFCWPSPPVSASCPNRSWTPRSGCGASTARGSDGGHAAGRHRGGGRRSGPVRARAALAPGTGRTPGDRTGEAATAFAFVQGPGRGAGSPWAWQPEPSAGVAAAASSDALPGDSLYGLKRGMEDIKLGLAHGDSDRGELYLDQASTRLSEARRLMERGRSGHLDHESLAEIRRTLSGMQHDASEGHRLLYEAYERDGSLGPIQALSAFAQSHREAWAHRATGCPSSSATSVSRSVGVRSHRRRGRPVAPGSPGEGGHGPSPGCKFGRPRLVVRYGPSGAQRQQRLRHRQPQQRQAEAVQHAAAPVRACSAAPRAGLLDPPKDTTSSSPSAGSCSPTSGVPDVTLPPLLPVKSPPGPGHRQRGTAGTPPRGRGRPSQEGRPQPRTSVTGGTSGGRTSVRPAEHPSEEDRPAPHQQLVQRVLDLLLTWSVRLNISSIGSSAASGG